MKLYNKKLQSHLTRQLFIVGRLWNNEAGKIARNALRFLWAEGAPEVANRCTGLQVGMTLC